MITSPPRLRGDEPAPAQVAAAEAKRQQLLRDLDEQVRAKRAAEEERRRREREEERRLEAQFHLEVQRKAALEARWRRTLCRAALRCAALGGPFPPVFLLAAALPSP